ncbi:MAG TPA: hypothetical protein VHC20_05150 [Candidatus Paceibacterota bacterium]|nr:hypothetical protein [Candidatus Paceibacterota bacterium]
MIVVAPLPWAAAYPSSLPAWLLKPVAGAPVLAWASITMMFALAGIARLSIGSTSAER